MALSTRTALSFWNAAVRDFPKNTVDALYVNEAWDLCNRAVRAVAHETYPVYANRYMTEGIVTQVSDEINLSSLPIQYGGWERLIRLETTIANMQRLLTSQTANKQGPFTTPLNSGSNFVYLPSPMPDLNWIFDVLSVSNGSYTIINRETWGFKIDVTENCVLTWAVARAGSVTTEVFTTMGANLEEISITKEVNVVAGDNIIGFGVELLDGYTVYPPIIASGSISYEVTEYKPTYIVVNVVGGSGKLHIEIKGQAVVNGTLLSSLVELRGIKNLTAGGNSIVFAAETGTASVSNYIFASIFNYNSGGSVSYEITSFSPTGFTINTSESSTLMWRIVQQGITLSGNWIGSGQKKRMCFEKQWAEFNVWNTDAKHNQYSIAYHVTGNSTGGMKILLKKGYGLSNWQSFVIRYPRIPDAISGPTSMVDLIEGMQMELGILLLRWMVAHRSTEHLELLKLVEGIPAQMQELLVKIYQTANLKYEGGQRLLKKAA